MSGKVLWHVTMSMDAFIAGPNDAMEWGFNYATIPSPETNAVIESTGAILVGRRWYDVATAKNGSLEGIYGGAWTGPVFVLTHRHAIILKNSSVTFLSKGIENAVSMALTAANGKNIVVLGSNVAHQCMEKRLVDEILVHIVPVLLGDGIRLFGGPRVGRTNMETLSVKRSGQITDIRLRVLK
jgi:dihydrofolate reductase